MVRLWIKDMHLTTYTSKILIQQVREIYGHVSIGEIRGMFRWTDIETECPELIPYDGSDRLTVARPHYYVDLERRRFYLLPNKDGILYCKYID